MIGLGGGGRKVELREVVDKLYLEVQGMSNRDFIRTMESVGCKLVKSEKDLKIGQEFGFLTIIAKTEKRQFRNVVYLCECICGERKEIMRQGLVRGNIKSCGCMKGELRKMTIQNENNKKKSKLSMRETKFEKYTLTEIFYDITDLAEGIFGKGTIASAKQNIHEVYDDDYDQKECKEFCEYRISQIKSQGNIDLSLGTIEIVFTNKESIRISASEDGYIRNITGT